MKRLIFLLALVFVSKALFAQTKQQIDSLENVIATSTQDTAKVMALSALSFDELDNVKRFSMLKKALVLARKIKFEKGEAGCYRGLGTYFREINDYPQSLEYSIKGLKIQENLNYTAGIASSLIDIGLVYAQQQNYEKALSYYFKAEDILKQTKIPRPFIVVYLRIGTAYLGQNKLDSALVYYTKSYEKATKAGAYSPLLLIGFGNVHTALGNTELALSYYRMVIATQIGNSDFSRLARARLRSGYLALAKLFTKTSNKDSAIYYAKQSLNMSRNKMEMVDAAKLLAQLYENRDDKQENRYLKMAMESQDSVFSRSNTAQFQSLSFIEQERQRELSESDLKEAGDRRHNLQLAALAIGLITFIILFFALSNSIIVKAKFIEFFGVLGLLAVFEFINLFIHPYLAHATDDSPVLMLLVLILIGAMLVPLHHKLEKWITKVMVEKNKKIRLEAAKKTITNLEPAFAETTAGKTEQSI